LGGGNAISSEVVILLGWLVGGLVDSVDTEMPIAETNKEAIT